VAIRTFIIWLLRISSSQGLRNLRANRAIPTVLTRRVKDLTLPILANCDGPINRGKALLMANWHDFCCFVFIPVGLLLQAIGRKIMSISDSLFGIHATALKLREQRMGMLASNIANAATPNYKARDMDFSTALRMAQNGQSTDAAMRYRIPTQESLDGNTVELATEQTAFAENALAYRSSLSFLQGRISTLTRALKGE
jgi:flagellar basal-body rod protein FlgB